MAQFKVAYSHNQLRLACESTFGPFYCVDCGEMILKRGDILTPHFAHKTDSKCSGESYEHKYAKRLISYHINKWAFTDRCDCGVYIRTHRFATANEEVPFGGTFRLDVAAFNGDGGLIGAIEVFHTHLIGQEKRDALNSSGLVVIEVEARYVIAAAENNTFHVFNRLNFPPCTECIGHAATAAARRAEQVNHVAKKARMDTELAAQRIQDALAKMEAQQTQNEVDAIKHALEDEAVMDHRIAVNQALEIEFVRAVADNRIYLALPQYRKYEALALTPGIHWDPNVDWNNPAIARHHIKVKSGSFWATTVDAMKLLPFWRKEYLDAKFHHRL